MHDLFVVITPAQILAGFAAWLLVSLLAMLGGMWVAWPQLRADPQPDGSQPDEPLECAETVELPGRARTHRTGTICAPSHGVPSDEVTQVVERVPW